MSETELQTRVAQAVETLYAGLTPTRGADANGQVGSATPFQPVSGAVSGTLGATIPPLSPTLEPVTGIPSPSLVALQPTEAFTRQPSVHPVASSTATPPSATQAATVIAAASATARPTQNNNGIIQLGVPGAYQPVGSHARISDLQAWQGLIYIAHGDWVQNTGPVRALAYDPATGALIWDGQYAFPEEQVEILRVLNGSLTVPGGDGQESWEYGSLYVRQSGLAWRQIRSLAGGVHLWDVQAKGEEWVAVGSGDAGDGRIWRSTDGGQSWNLDPAGPELLGVDAQNPLNTHAGLFQLHGQFYLTSQRGCYLLAGSNWLPAPGCDLTGRSHHKWLEWQGLALLVPYASSPVQAAQFLLAYDGSGITKYDFSQQVLDLAVMGERLLVLTAPQAGQARIFTATSLAEGFSLAAELAMPPLNVQKPYAAWPLSLEVWEGWLYLGLQDGQLLKYPLED